jgi:drug/metabolite transporter (DMT)-like permease
VGIIGMVEPVIAAAVAWLTLGEGEALNAAQLTGGALVLAGVILAEIARAAPEAVPTLDAIAVADTAPLDSTAVD